MLSSSALSTATALSALALANVEHDAERIRGGVAWLAGHQNADGGWGDTVDSPSNLATTLLAIAALRLAAAAGIPSSPDLTKRAEGHVASQSNQLAASQNQIPSSDRKAAGDEDHVAQAIQLAYGADRTFATPILMNCALAGLVSWPQVPSLPFELSVLPHRCYKLLRLHVVSYALPALIAIGLAVDRRHPPRSVLLRMMRRAVTSRALAKLQQIQPDHGGFLDATPLTSFVAMGLIPSLGPEQPVAARCLQFLRQSQRADGSWPIDTDLSVWLTTSSVAALAAAGAVAQLDCDPTTQWIAAQQCTAVHPFTQAAAGGWAWTHLAGGVPDADDTAGAVIALAELGYRNGVDAGVKWLLDLQNGDGGWPTFCRGWGKLPFDCSAPDVTAHALRAIHRADRNASTGRQRRAVRNGQDYLCRVQQSDGSWIPLWFGSQKAPGQGNLVVGTSLVLRALEILDGSGRHAARGIEYLYSAQNADGGWGGARGIASSVEETALAVAALAGWAHRPAARDSLSQGLQYLLANVRASLEQPAAIGLYFSRLWYSERLYPLIWTIEALGRATRR
jgi:squalene-hopene/tetraprenyl-beta-curcumene cyclase